MRGGQRLALSVICSHLISRQSLIEPRVSLIGQADWPGLSALQELGYRLAWLFCEQVFYPVNCPLLVFTIESWLHALNIDKTDIVSWEAHGCGRVVRHDGWQCRAVQGLGKSVKCFLRKENTYLLYKQVKTLIEWYDEFLCAFTFKQFLAVCFKCLTWEMFEVHPRHF